jgi:tetratricopeptide (TPR) repeat protein
LFKDRGLSVNPKRVVVASFENQTGDNSYDIIGRMTADWITQGLAQTGFLTVVPVSLEEIITGAPQREDRIRKLAKNSGAGTVVSGSYYLQGNIVYFQAKISNAQEDLLSAIEPVNGPIENPLKPIQLLSQRIMGALATIVDPRLEIFVDIKSQPPTYESYQEYIEGLTFFLQRKYRQAIEHLQQAAALDSTFVLPLLWASVAHKNLDEYAKAEAIAKEIEKHRENLNPANRHFLDLIHAWFQGNIGAAYREAREMARLAPGEVWNYQFGLEAIRYNHPQEAIEVLTLLNPEGIWMKGWYHYWDVLTRAHHMLGNHKQELKMARRGRKQFPEFLSTLWYETRALAALGRIKEVNKLIDESLALPPQPEWNPGEIMLYAAQELRAHGYREASIQVVDRSINWFKSRSQEELDAEGQRYILARVLYTAERWDEAKDVFDLLHKEFPDNVDYLAYIGMLAARRGNRDEAQKISSQLENIKRPYLYGTHTYGRACIAALLGEKETAISLLREAIAQGVAYSGLHPDMNLDPLSDYPAFKELIKPKG